MARDNNYGALFAFVTVVREASFTRAAAKIGVSQSALSHAIRALEMSLEVRLLTRTTRNVSPTEAGQALFDSISGPLDAIDEHVETVSRFRDKPAGTIRITATDYAIRQILWPKLSGFLERYPDIKAELVCDYGRVDIAAQRFDAGVRFGEQLAQDMIAVRIGPDERFAVVGTQAYFARHGVPQSPDDLTQHQCINLRLATHGGLYAWEFAHDGRDAVNVKVDGRLTFNGIYEVLEAALAGFGLCYVPETMVTDHVASGRLVRVMQAWCPLWTGYHLYYPSRRQPSRAMSLLIDELRYGE